VRRICALALVSAGWLWCADPQTERLPPGPGKAEVGAVCVACHAKANDDQIAAILDYLTLNFGKDSKIRVNTAPMVEFKAVLGLTADEADAMVAYRDANGAFHNLSDLLKVAGVDGKKIEAKKDLLEF